MPYVKSSATKVAELAWDTFPAPTLEAEQWQPDPDSIPVAGGLPDPRFNKGPLTQLQKQVLKRDKLLGLDRDAHGKNTSSAGSKSRTHSPAGVGSWPAATPRATGYPRAVAPAVQHSLFSASESVAPVETASVASIKTLPSAAQVTGSSKVTNSYKGTMETLSVQAWFQRPHTPPMSITSQASESPAKTSIPSWARKMEHLLAEKPSKEFPPKSAPLSRPSIEQAAVPAASISKPPHLRKQQHILDGSVAPVASLRSQVDIREKIDTPPLGVPPAPIPVPLLFDSTRHTPGAFTASRIESATPEVVVASQKSQLTHADPVQELKMQKAILENFIPKKTAASSKAHECYLRVKIINIMEDEMDMSRRMTRRELNNMSEKELDSHFNKTKAMHKLTWETKQRRNNIDEKDVNALPPAL